MKSFPVNPIEEKINSQRQNKMMAWNAACGTKSRDSWAIGASPQFVVGVWLGNSDGSGNTLLSSNDFASSILLEVNNYLNPIKSFRMPVSEMSRVFVCKKSGLIASSSCQNKELKWVPTVGLKTSACMAHQ